MYLYPDNLYQKLEFDQLLQLLAGHCVSTTAREQAIALRPANCAERVDYLQQLAYESFQLQAYDGGMPDASIPHISAYLRTAFIEGAYLDEEQCFELLKLLLYVKRLLGFFESRKEQYPLLHGLTHSFELPRQAVDALDRVIGPEGRLKPNASRELADIVASLNKLQAETRRKLDSIYRRAKAEGWVAETGITIRDGRLVIPVLAEHKRKLRGFVHDASSTGQTVFIEPAEVLEGNNEIRALELAEQREIRRILVALTTEIRPYLPQIEEAHALAVQYDLLRAKALLALRFPFAIRPETNDSSTELRDAYHPLLFLHHQAQRKPVQPLQISLEASSRILVISGPNAGGKSVTLKTVGLLQLMYQCGLLVPAKEGSKMRIFQKILVDLGDEQSIENDLSTYSSHLTNMRRFCEQADGNSLFLIDEFGTGTDPHLGGPIAEAILERLTAQGSYGVVNTHYSNLKLLPTRLAGLKNGSMGFNTESLEPRFVLEMGKPGSSFAFEIAGKIGLPTDVIAAARAKLAAGQQDVEQLLVQLEQEKQELDRLKTLIDYKDQLLSELVSRTEAREQELKARKKQILDQAREDANQLLAKANKDIESTIRQIREQGAEKEATKALRSNLEQLREEVLKATATETPAKSTKALQQSLQLEVGARVRLKDSDTLGEVLEINKNDVVLAVGSLRMTVKASRVEVVSKAEARKQERKATAQTGKVVREAVGDFSPNLDIRGFRGIEALQELDRFLDRAVMGGYDTLSILHGKGDGILRKLIREHLRKQRFVSSFESEHIERGGDGITIVYLS